jgi:acyl-CoA synthetase (AMP-forming)/AMP-acid ligase II
VIARHQPGSATAAPSFLETLSDYCIERGRQLPGLTGIFCGGAPVFPPLLKKLRAIAPAAKIVAVYGSTEAEPIAELSFADISAEDMVGMSGGKGLLAGSPVEPIQLRIIRDRWGTSLGPFSLDEFEGLALPSGEPGEIVVTGNHVLKGYLNGQGDRETKFTVDKATWHRTGDSGYLDNRGRLWLLGRCEAVLSDDRGKLYPFAVESTAQLLPGIQRAALVSDCGKRTLVVEPAKAAARIDSAAIKQKLSWAQIDSVKICRKIPVDRRHNSKIDYERLRRILRSLGSEA